jgi:hypothetical protein
MPSRVREGFIVALALTLLVVAPASGEHYAVLLAGTPKPAESDDLFFNRITRMYDALTDHLNFLAENILILSSDGSHTYDGQALSSATGANLQGALTDLALNPRDTFVFATVAHGSGDYDDDSTTNEERIAGYDGDHIADDEFISWISGIGAGRDAYFFTQCFSGGFLQELDFTNRERFGCASATHYEYSWYDPLGPQKGFLGWLAKGIEEGDPSDPVDTSLTETEDIYIYARDNDPFVTDGEGPDGEPADLLHHPWMLGDNIDLAVAHWLGGHDNGNWDHPDNWRAGVLPQHDRTVRIAPGDPAVMDGATQAIRQLMIQPGGTLELTGSAELYPDDIENEGTLRVTDGFLQAFGDIWNQDPATSSIEVGADGWILADALHNDASVVVDGGELDVYAASDNAGTVSVSNGGLLLLSCDVQHSGLIDVASGGQVRVTGSLEMLLPGEVHLSGSNSTLEVTGNFRADGKITADAGASVDVSGHFEAGKNQTSTITLTDAELAVSDPASMMFFARDHTTIVEATRSLIFAAGVLYVGERSYAKATVRGGTMAAESIYIGNDSAGEGWLVLEQDGSNTPTLAIGDALSPTVVGYSGVGTLTQNAGAVTRGDQDGAYPALILGYDAEGTGRYELNDGSLHADTLTVARSGTGTFLQSGGTSLVDQDLHIGLNSGSLGVVTLSGGSMTVRNVLGGSGDSELNIDGGDLKLNGTLIQIETLNIGTSYGSTGRLELTGKTVSADEMTVGVEGDGTYVATSGVTNIASHLRVGETHTGRVKQAGGTVTTDWMTLGYWSGSHGEYNLQAGTLDVTGAMLTVGLQGVGTFTQAPGTTITTQRVRIASETSVGSVYDLSGGNLVVTTETTVGSGPSADGLLRVRGGSIDTPEMFVGDYGHGEVMQEDGLIDVAATLYVGKSGTGDYQLSGGTLRTQETVLGEYSDTCRGSMVQTGGTHEVSGDLYVGMAGNQSSYSLDGEGTLLSCGSLYVGYQTMATFTQSGGETLVAQDVCVGHETNGYGMYYLNGGSLAAGGFVFVGSTGGAGLLQLNGGSLSCNAGWLGASSGSSVSGYGGIDATVSSFGHIRAEMGTLTIHGSCNSYGSASIEPGATLRLEDTSTFEGLLTNDGALDVASGRTSLNGGVTGIGDISVAFGAELEIACELSGQNMTVAGAALHSSGTATWTGAADIPTGGQYLLQHTGRIVPVPMLLFDPPTTLATSETHADGQFLHQGGTHTSDALFIGGTSGALYEMAQGTLSVGELHVGLSFSDGDAPGTLRFLDPAAKIEVSVEMLIHPQGRLEAAPGTVIHMTGSAFDNRCTDPSAADDLSDLLMVFEGGVGDLDPFEVAGRDLGADPGAFSGNFALGALIIGGSDVGRVQLVDNTDNHPDWGGPEALYVNALKVAPGCELDLNGLNLYYLQGHIPDGAILNTGGGALVQVPEPTAFASLMVCALVSLCRRRSG